MLDEHRLAGTGRAEHHRDLVVGKAERQAVQDPHAAELLDDVDYLDRVLAAVVALLARVPLVGVVLVGGDARKDVVLVQVPEVRRGLLVGLGVALLLLGELLELGLPLLAILAIRLRARCGPPVVGGVRVLVVESSSAS